MVSLTIAYILWFFGGFFGLHHFYLKRDRHAFVWWGTLGGVFGLGWLRDLLNLPEYVREANRDHDWQERYNERIRFYGRPPRSTARFAGQIIMGNILGYLIRSIIPEQFVTSEKFNPGFILAVTLPQVGAAIGVHLVSNIGRHKVSWSWPMIGAFLPTPWLIINPENITLSPLVSAIMTQWKGVQWKIGPDKQRGFCKRISTLTFYGTLYLALWGCVIYFNASVTTRDGETIPLREAIPNFFKSPAWAETKDSFKRLYNYYKVHGWHRLYEELVDALDPVGELNAYKVLNVSSSASQEEITKQYRRMARQWHPDKHKDPKEKEEASEKFIEIQNAYNTLSSIKAKRAEKNKESTKPTKHEF